MARILGKGVLVALCALSLGGVCHAGQKPASHDEYNPLLEPATATMACFKASGSDDAGPDWRHLAESAAPEQKPGNREPGFVFSYPVNLDSADEDILSDKAYDAITVRVVNMSLQRAGAMLGWLDPGQDNPRAHEAEVWLGLTIRVGGS
ncbi:MAG: hypothetical protein HY751_11035 [Nitrospinae bacterium]|nr:hypothetical protein [Nitrospinota bacterium]